jgi:hypothetical protein
MPPKYLDQIQFRGIWGSVLHDQSFLFPLRATCGKCFAGRNRSILHDHHRFFLACLAPCLTTSAHHCGRHGWFKDQRRPIILSVHASPDMQAAICSCRHCDHRARLWPSLGERGSTGKACFSKIIQSNPPLLCLWLSGCKLTLTWSQGERSAPPLAGFPDTFPAKPCLVCQTFSGRQAETLRGLLCEALANMFEGTWFCFQILLGERLCSGMQCGGSAATRLLRPTFVTLLCPCLDPWSNRISVHMLSLGNGFDRDGLAAQHKTMGTQTSAL